jgi:TonB family protein
MHSLWPIYLAILGSTFAQKKEFLDREFSLVQEQADSIGVYYRLQSENQPNTYLLYDLEGSAIGKEEVELGTEGHIIRNILLVYPSLSPKEGHLIEERKINTRRKSRYFDENGNLTQEEELNNGLVKFRAYYDGEGNVVKEDTIILASPNGGMTGWNDHMSRTLTYPKSAKQAKAQGTVYIHFDVDENGKTRNYICLREEGLHPDLIKEAIRVIDAYRRGWIPYSINGQKMNSQVVLPIRFRLS